ncbi:type III secretion system inner membrane ring lipoprotein SctJ [Burkholderia territorii]|uniref:type III secretion system inner membrane ring lipoprotein SctJ n=1 Tax=Burkholderia territorii TaxID=1503055 RepID=UPI0009BD0517|nr:type III secretion inner membrane ring lipoprotein SctJ [Burkholderia territorii]
MSKVAIRRFICGVALIFLVGMSGCNKKIELRTGVSESDANEIIAALLDADIPTEKTLAKDGYAVNIDEENISAAVKVLESAGLPHDPHAQMGDIFKKDGMISSPLEERGRYLFALSQELERTLDQIDGVLVARVHIVLSERIAPGEPVQPSSAAVFIKYRSDVDLQTREFAIRRLVAASIPGLSENSQSQIAVVFIPAQGNSSPELPAPATSHAAASGAHVAHADFLSATAAAIIASTSIVVLAVAICAWTFRARLHQFRTPPTVRGMEK